MGTTDYLENFKKRNTSKDLTETVESILFDVSNQLHDYFKEYKLTAILNGAGGQDLNYRTLSINIVTLSNTDYSYRLINITLPVDSEFPFKASAFLNPPLEDTIFKEGQYNVFKEWIKNSVIGNIRMNIVIEHMKTMEKNINDWRNEKFK